GPAEGAGRAEGGDDEPLARRQRGAQGRRRRDAVQPRHLHVEQGDVGADLTGLLDHFVAPAHLGHDLQIGFQVQQRGQSTPHQCLVVGEQQADHTHTRSSKPPSCALPTVKLAPAASTRSRRPTSPTPLPAPPPAHPFIGPGPSPVTRFSLSVPLTRQCAAPLWRTTLVTPSRSTQPNSSRRSAGTSSRACGSSASIPAAARAERALASSPISVTCR